MGLKWVKRDEVIVSRCALEDAVSNGVLTKAAQEVLSDESGIEIKVPVGRPKKKKK